jgi:nucleotide-binding universal stress UspA family protein
MARGPGPQEREAAVAQPAGPVVVGVDSTERAVGALRWAGAEAARLSCELVAVLATGGARLTAPYAPVASRCKADGATPEECLARAVEAAFHGSPPVPVRLACDPRPPVPALLAHGAGAALLVLATSPEPPPLRTRLGGGHGGSTVLALVRHAPCPVVLLPVDRHPAPGVPAGQAALAAS